jgi:hypothetical protein
MGYPHTATCRFRVAAWEESVVVDIDDAGTRAGETYYPTRGFSRAAVAYTYSGDVEGTSTLGYLIAYRPGGAPTFGIEHLIGSVNGHEGSLVLLHTGDHDADGVREHLEILPGMGTGALAGITGEAELTLSGHSDDGYELVLHYDLS